MWPCRLLSRVDEAVLRQQLDVFCEHREERAHEEGGNGFGAVAAFFQRSGEQSQALCDLAGDAGASEGRVERLRVGPRAAEGLAHVDVAESGEQDTVTLRIRERDVSAAGAGELGVELDAVPDIDDNEQRRAAFARGQSAGILCSACPRALSMASSHAALPRWAWPFFAALAFAFVASASATAASRFSTPCLASRT